MTLPIAGSGPASPVELLDANVVIRYLLGDHPEHSARARALIDTKRPLRLSVVTLIETCYVLTRVAGVPRVDTVDAVVDLLERENIEVHEVDTDVVVAALGFCRASGRVSFGDALLWAVARGAQPARLWSFDRRFPPQGIDLKMP